MKKVMIRLENGNLSNCVVIESLGWQPGIGAYAREVRDPTGRVFMAVGSRGVWRAWGIRDKLRPRSLVTGQ